jgi:hypothetical protein
VDYEPNRPHANHFFFNAVSRPLMKPLAYWALFKIAARALPTLGEAIRASSLPFLA